MIPFPETEVLPFISLVPPALLITILVVLALWTTIIKAFALWYAARNGQRLWFVALLVLNTLGILELVYLLAFREDRQSYVAPAPAVAPEKPRA